MLYSYGIDYKPMLLDDVNCANNYLTILQCSFSTYIDSGCINSNYYDATVYCYEFSIIDKDGDFDNVTDATRIWDCNPHSVMIRLQGGTHSNQGRV